MKRTETLYLSASAVGEPRTEELHGREYSVFPAVLVQAQVLQNNLGRVLLPAEALTDLWADAWNQTPVIVGPEHPTQRGVHVSARQPTVLNKLGAGFVFDARIAASKGKAQLKADVWLDASRAEAVPDLEKVLKSLSQREPVELSTGFAVFVEEEEGELDGEPYDLVMRPVGTADHLLVISEGKGACSLEHGCGLGVNVLSEARTPTYTSTTEERWSVPGLSAFEPDAAWADLSDERKEEIVATTLLGEVAETFSDSMLFPVVDAEGRLNRNALNAVRSISRGGRGGANIPEAAAESAFQKAGQLLEEEFKVEASEDVEHKKKLWQRVKDAIFGQSDSDRRQLLHSAIMERFGSSFPGDRHIWIEDVFSEDQLLVFEVSGGGQGAGLFRISYEINDEGAVTLGEPEKVIRVTDYEPVTNTGGGEDMKRKELIATLAADGPLTEEELEKLEDHQLEALHSAQETDGGEGGAEGGEADPPKGAAQEGEGEGEGKPPRDAEHRAALKRLEERLEKQDELIATQAKTIESLQEATAPAVAEQQRERDALLQELGANELVPFDEDELKVKPLEELKKIASLAKGRSYVGRGGPRQPEPATAAFVDPRPYWETQQPKEA